MLKRRKYVALGHIYLLDDRGRPAVHLLQLDHNLMNWTEALPTPESYRC